VLILSACTKADETKEQPTSSPVSTIEQTTSVEPTTVPIKTPKDDPDEMLKYQSDHGWSILYPASWDSVNKGSIMETASEKYISFETHEIPKDGIIATNSAELVE
jgi:hypothetical protein